jgi:hypothetical protein
VAASIDEVAERLFATVLAPLVLGGPLRPAHPVGARVALALLASAPRPLDADLASRVELARVRGARRLAPVDRVDEPSGEVWALGAALHDLLQVAHPGWVRRSAPKRLLDLVGTALERVPPPQTARDALFRHTWFERLFGIVRTDTTVSWWTGTRDFLGSSPPPRLLAWPSVRRVHVATAPRGVMDLLSHGGTTALQPAFAQVLERFLRATPLTDLASVARGSPEFAWSPEALALVRSPVARTLALRAASLGPEAETDAALGRATRAVLASRAWSAAAVAMDFLGHRALAAAQTREASGASATEGTEPAAFARAAGALVARKWIDDPQMALPDAERRRLAPILDAASRSQVAREIAGIIGASG